MRRLRALLSGLLILVSTLPLSGCTKVVSWEEEVVLNTGETLQVQRLVTYTRAGAPGNPLDIGWRAQDGGEMRFVWKGRSYVFREHSGPLVFAISPQGTPVVVINPSAGRWDVIHKLGCRYPHYVQFVPDASGERWTWPAAVEPWLFRLPTNLLQNPPNPERGFAKYRAQDVREANSQLRLSKFDRFIDPQFTADNCRKD